LTWSEAAEACLAKSARLPEIYSLGDNNVIKAVMVISNKLDFPLSSEVKPVLMTISEQQSPVYKGQPDPQVFIINSNF
jgi:hypothetical protein